MATELSINAGRQEQGTHLRDYWRLVWMRRWAVCACFLGTIFLAGAWSFLQTPIYEATATVEAQTSAPRVLSGPDVSGLGATGFGWSADERFYSTQIEIIRSRDLAERVIKRLGLSEDPMFAGVKDPVGALAGMVNADLLKDTGVIQISVISADRARAAELANAFAREYVQRNFDLGRQAVRRMFDEMTRQIEPIKGKITAADKERFGIARESKLYIPENQQSILEANRRSYNDELSKVRIEMGMWAGVIDNLQEIETTKGDPLTIREIAQDDPVRKLVEERNALEKEQEALRVKYRPGAPEFKQVESKLEKVRTSLDESIRSLAASFRGRYTLLKDRAQALQAQIDNTNRESFEVGQRTSDYETAKTDAETRRKIYDALSQSINQVSLQANLLNNNLRILDLAMVPSAPIKPRTRMNLVLGTMFGLFMGVGFAFFLDYLDNTIRSSDDIEQLLGLHLLSIIPRYRETTGHAVREAYQSLRTSVLFSSKGRQDKLLLITSAGPREGKTSTIVNLARTMASAGERVVLVDCDLRRPKIHEDLALERDHGLTNYLAGMESGTYRDFVKPTAFPTLFALTSGPIPPNPPELFGTERFRDLLVALRRDFDWVLLDSPPVVSLTDAVILASLVDMVAFVVKHNENDRDMIRRYVAQIRNVNPNVIGAVLNNVDIERGGADYYYAGYYYYSPEGDSRKKRRERERESREKVGAAR